MKTLLFLLSASLLSAAEPPNPIIDYDGFVALTKDVAELRESSRISEEQFLKFAAEPDTVILDTRSREKFEKLHIKGAVHLNFSDFGEESLGKLIPKKTTRVLIYCNNNFLGEPELFFSKGAPLALNIPTFINLRGYGYTNVFELGPLLEMKDTKIPFSGTSQK